MHGNSNIKKKIMVTLLNYFLSDYAEYRQL